MCYTVAVKPNRKATKPETRKGRKVVLRYKYTTMKEKRQEELYPVELTQELYEHYCDKKDEKAGFVGNISKDMRDQAETLDYMAGLCVRVSGWAKSRADLTQDARDLQAVGKWYSVPAIGGGKVYGSNSIYKKYRMCGYRMEGGQPMTADDQPKGAIKVTAVEYTCKDAMCPRCSKVKANKRERYYTAALDEINRAKISRDGGNGYGYLQIILDIGQNCQGYELPEKLSKISAGITRLVQWSRLEKVMRCVPWVWLHPDASDSAKEKNSAKKVAAYMVGLEITRNTDKNSEWYGTYHPHFHFIAMVNPSYFKDTKIHISRAELLEKWRYIMDDDTITNGKIGKTASAHQALKYAVKGATAKKAKDADTEALWTQDPIFDAESLRDIHEAIEGRKMFRASSDLAQRAKALAKQAGDDLEDEETDTEPDNTPVRRVSLRRTKAVVEIEAVGEMTTTAALLEEAKSRKAELKAAAESRKEAKLNQSEYARQRAASGQERLQDIKDRAAAGDYAAKAALGQAQARQYERTRRKEMDAADRISDEDAKELAYKLIEETYYNKPCTAVNLQVKYKFGKRQSKKLAELIEKLKKGE